MQRKFVFLSDNPGWGVEGQILERERGLAAFQLSGGGREERLDLEDPRPAFDNPFWFLPHTTNFCLIAVLHFVETSSKQYLSVSRQKQ